MEGGEKNHQARERKDARGSNSHAPNLALSKPTPSRMSVQKIKNNNAFHILNEIRQSLAF